MKEKHERIIGQILAALPERDRQALVRFYVAGEPTEVVCRKAGLTEVQFRLLKTATKARFLALSRG